MHVDSFLGMIFGRLQLCPQYNIIEVILNLTIYGVRVMSVYLQQYVCIVDRYYLYTMCIVYTVA